MVEGTYQVDHHLIQMAYFHGNESLPTGSAFAEIWKNLGKLGKHQLTGKFWQLGAVPDSKPDRFPLASEDAFRELLDCRAEYILGGGSSQKKKAAQPNADYDFYLALLDASRCAFGPTLPHFQMAISNQWLTQAGCDVVLEALRENFEILDQTAPPYAFIDISRPVETFAGLMYTSIMPASGPLNRWIENAQWLRSIQENTDQARSVYWGNYFGPGLLEKLGGRAEFVKSYREKARLPDASPSALIWEYGNGVFVSLCLDPRQLAPGKSISVAASNMRWLYKRMSDSGALMGG